MARISDRALALNISRPTQQVVLMLIICGAVGTGGFFIWPQVMPVFLASPYLNGTIALVFIIGVLATFFQLFQLFSAASWIEDVALADQNDDIAHPPRLLVAMTGIARFRGTRMQITGSAARSILDSVGSRMDESREITRYIANLLIFLGLLGTFFGLATTIPAVVDTIRSLQPGEGEGGVAVFGRLMNGLDDQLGGMGTAFASSLLGLAGSLIVGLLELYAGHGQNRFYRGLEEWLASITRVGLSGDGEGGGGGVDRSALATVLDHMVDQMDAMQALFYQSQHRSAQTEARMLELSESVGTLTSRMANSAHAQERLAQSQDRLAEQIRISNAEGPDSETQMRLRSIDVQLLKIYQELGNGRVEDMDNLRRDLAELTTALRDLTRMAARPTQTRPTGPSHGAGG
jgi:hypothetical protein